MKFSIKDLFSKCEQIRRKDLFTFTKEILNGKLHFLCSVTSFERGLVLRLKAQNVLFTVHVTLVISVD